METKVHQAAQQGEAQLRLEVVAKATQTGIYDWPLGGGEVWRSETFYQILGYTPGQFDESKEWWLPLIHPEHRDATNAKLHAVLQQEQANFEFEYQVQNSQGGYQFISDKGYVLYENGKPIRIIGAISDISARKAKEAALHESEDRFSTLFSQAPIAMLILREADMIILNANDSFMELTGMERVEIVGQHCPSLPIWNDMKSYREIRKRLEIHGQVRKEKISMINKKGEELQLHVYASSIELNGESCSLVIFNNISDQIKAEQAIRESEARFRGIFQNAGMGIVVTNSMGKVLESNSVMCQLIGLSKEEMASRTLFSLYNPAYRESERQRFWKIHKGQATPSDAQVVLRHKHGDAIWAKATISFVKGEKQIPTYGVAIFEDISAQKAAAAQIDESQALLRTINNNINDGIFRSALERGLVYANQAFIDLFGYDSFEAIKDVPTAELYQDRTQQQHLMAKLQQEGYLRNEEVFLKRRDGSHFWALFTCTITVKEEGITYFDGAIIDITRLKDVQKLLQEQNSELEKINKELDRFVYSASHDLRAPLTSLLGLLELLQMQVQNDETLPYFEMMRKSITKLDLFIREIVNYSRNARTDVVSSVIDVKALVEGIFEDLGHMEGAERIRKVIDVEQEADMYSDKSRLSHICSNLISNAIRYHHFHQPDPYIKVSIHVSPEKATISVSDNGKGIKEVHQSRIFEMFYRASDDSKGSGLGLYIVKESVEKLGGRIWLSSKPNAGSTFTFEVPNLMP